LKCLETGCPQGLLIAAVKLLGQVMHKAEDLGQLAVGRAKIMLGVVRIRLQMGA